MMNVNSTKIFSWKKAVLLSLSVGLLAAGLSLFLQTRAIPVQALEEAALSAMPAPVGSGTSFAPPSLPARLIIPAISVNAVVQSVGLSWKGDGTMGIPSNFTDVAWYNQGPRPGMPGIAVINGHLDGKDVPQAVFYNLDKLKTGDLVEIADNKGNILQFRVIGSKTYDYDAPTDDIFFGDSAKIRLNLITCTGDWNREHKVYEKRIVVTAELVDKSDLNA